MFSTFLITILLVIGSNFFVMVLPLDHEISLSMTATAAPPFSGGDGSSSNPFQITNVSQLQNMSSNLSASYRLMNDIDATNTSTWNNGDGFDPIGDSANKFDGTFDGRGYKIKGLYFDLIVNYRGLFGYTTTNTIIIDVTLVNITILGANNYIGPLVGFNRGTITNCHSTGIVNGNDYVGGLVGMNRGSIVDCSAKCDVGNISGQQRIGGLVGDNKNGEIVDSNSIGDVNGTSYIGGLVGKMGRGFINFSYSISNVTGSNNRIGGLVGGSRGYIRYCNSSGEISGFSRIGGLVGEKNDGSYANNSNARTNVTGSIFTGGLVGFNDGGATLHCTAKGNVTNTVATAGGLIGYNDNGGTIINCTASGKVSSPGNAVGGLVGDLNYDSLINHSSADCTVNGSTYVGGLVGWCSDSIIDNSYSTGNVNGTSWSVGGLVGVTVYSTKYSEILNCYATGSVIGWRYVGGLVGTLDAYVRNSYATGSVTGLIHEVGGLIGENSGGFVYESYATGTVTGDTNIGGLVGNNMGTVNNTYATGLVIGDDLVGGHSGYNDGGTISNSYSTGNATGNTNFGGFVGSSTGTITACFWDKENSGNNYSAGGGGVVGKNTNAMKQKTTFTNVAWNFVNVWGIIETQTYPILLTFHYPPEIITQDIGTATEDSLYSINLEAYYSGYPPENDIDWSLNTNTGNWLSIDTNGALSGTPANDDVGSFWVDVKVTDLVGKSSSTNFSLVVLNTNDPPTITTIELENATEDLLYNFNLVGEDIDPSNDLLNWSIDTNADWLMINNQTGALSGTPTNDDVEMAFWVDITVDDGNGGSDSENLSLWVDNVNDPPVIIPFELEDAVEDQEFFNNFDAEDIDPIGGARTWSMITDADWLEINSSFGVVRGTPMNKDVGSIWLNVTVDDGDGGIDWANVSISVLNVNDDPVILTEDDVTAKVDEAYSIDYEANDIDPTDDILTWSLNSNASWLEIDTVTGVISGVPDSGDVGNYWVNVTVSDGNGGLDWHNYTLSVIPGEQEPNMDPVIITQDVVEAEAGKKYSVDYEATDDRTPIASLRWTMHTDASWLGINETTGVLSGTPAESDIGSYWVNITVGDGENGLAFTNFTITVIEGVIKNNKPELTNGKMTPESGDTDTKFSFTVTYTDTDNDPGNVWVWIDNEAYKMTADPNDDDFSDGVDYTYKTKLGVGNHTYYFTGSDGTDDAGAGDTTTPTSPELAISTTEINEAEKKDKEEDNLMVYLAIIIVIIIIILLLAFAMSRGKREEDLAEEEIEEDEFEDEGYEDVEEEAEEADEIECPECGVVLPADEVVCPECGSELPESDMELEDELEDEDFKEEELEDEELEDEEFEEE
jgi:hypothetical protein